MWVTLFLTNSFLSLLSWSPNPTGQEFVAGFERLSNLLKLASSRVRTKIQFCLMPKPVFLSTVLQGLLFLPSARKNYLKCNAEKGNTSLIFISVHANNLHSWNIFPYVKSILLQVQVISLALSQKSCRPAGHEDFVFVQGVFIP